MAGTIIVSDIKTDTDNSFVVRANTGNVLFRVTDTGLDTANSIASGSITSDMIADGTVIAADVADGSITTAKIADGNVTAAKIDTVANTQVTGVMTTSQVADSAITVSKLATTVAGALGTRNLIINGDMRIAQRGSSLATSSSEGYIIDRYLVGSFNGNTVTYSQDTDVPSGYGFTNSMKVTNTTGTAASTFEAIQQRIEGLITSQLDFGSASAKQITLSFWVKSSVTGTYSVGLRNSGNTRGYVADYTISSANTWEKKTVTITGDTTGTWLTTNGIGIRTFFVLGASAGNSTTPGSWSASANMGSTNLSNTWTTTSSATFYITGIQLEVGDTATPFEHRPYDMELARCQRYFVKFGGDSAYTPYGTGNNYSTTNGTMVVKFPVSMRTTPTLTVTTPNRVLSGSVASSVTSMSLGNGGALSAYLDYTSTGLTVGYGSYITSNGSTAGTISFSSEL